MTPNAILDELHAIRRQILADYNGDTAAYLRDAQARLEASGRPIAQRKQRKIKKTLKPRNQAAGHYTSDFRDSDPNHLYP